MSKRPSSPVANGSSGSKARAAGGSSSAAAAAAGPSQQQKPVRKSGLDAQGDEGMGQFEDDFEDEFEEDGEVIDNASDGEGDMEIDGVKIDGEIQRPSDDEDEPEVDDTQAYIPGVGAPLPEGQQLEPDQSAYEMLHRLNVTWPCLSFDILQDSLGSVAERQRYPHTAYFVAGTQADTAKNNELMVMKASSMHKTQKDGADEDDDDEDDDDDDDGLDDDAILEYKSIPHLGGINRVRAAPVAPPVSSPEPLLDPYPVATWSELGQVDIWDVRPLFNALDRPGTAFDRKAVRPMHTVKTHAIEGYALDWAGSGGSSTGKASSLRLLSGDLHSKIFLTTSNQSGFTTHAAPFTSHTSSVEDLQWSPKETTVFASCSADRSVRVWDVRVKNRRSVIAVPEAHTQDVNVISWNKHTDYLLVSGGDEGGLNVWDLRNFKPSSTSGATAGAAAPRPTPVASFSWHTAPISSVEWHPTEDSVFAAAGRDDQVTLWDLSVEQDDEEQGEMQAYKGPGGREVPHQLLFCHHGASEIKEVHWHPQIGGMLMTTSADGFHLFKTISV